MILTDQQRLSIADEIVRDLNSLKGTNLNTDVMSISADSILKSPTADFSTQAMLMSTDNRICVNVIRKHQAYLAWADDQVDPLLGDYHVNNSGVVDFIDVLFTKLYFKVTPSTNYPLASFNVRLEYTNISPVNQLSMVYDSATGLGYLNNVVQNATMPSGDVSVILSRNGADIGLLKLQIVYGGSLTNSAYDSADYIVYSPFIPTQVPPEAYM